MLCCFTYISLLKLQLHHVNRHLWPYPLCQHGLVQALASPSMCSCLVICEMKIPVTNTNIIDKLPHRHIKGFSHTSVHPVMINLNLTVQSVLFTSPPTCLPGWQCCGKGYPCKHNQRPYCLLLWYDLMIWNGRPDSIHSPTAASSRAVSLKRMMRIMLVSWLWTWHQGPWTLSHLPEGHTQAGIATPSQTPIVGKSGWSFFILFSHLGEITKCRQWIDGT